MRSFGLFCSMISPFSAESPFSSETPWCIFFVVSSLFCILIHLIYLISFSFSLCIHFDSFFHTLHVMSPGFLCVPDSPFTSFFLSAD